MALFYTLFKYLAYAVVVSTYKSLPLAYTVRFYYHIIVNLFVPRAKYDTNGELNTFGITNVFQTVNLATYNSLLEVDFYMHKSNSTYFSDLDISRTKLLTQVFQKFFYKCGDNSNGMFKKPSYSNWPYVPVASVSSIFKHEIKPFARYTVQSRVLAWDNKWLFILSKFVLPGGKVCCVSLTKYVFKNGRITIKPEVYIKQSGLWNDEVSKVNDENYKYVQHFVDTGDLEELSML